MPDWRAALSRLTDEVRSEVAAHVRAASDVLRTRFASGAPYAVAPYRGYGTPARFLVHGRALQAAPLPPAQATDSAWRNLRSMYERLESDPLPAAEVRVRVAGVTRAAVADGEGFFQAWVTPATRLDPNAGWHEAELELTAPRRDDGPAARATARVRVPGERARFVVVSDIDDTVLQSRVSNLVQAVRTTLFGNALTRLPFPGVAAFYRALERGRDGAEHNPIFYLSSSPWNIHDLLAEFMDAQRLPEGPLLLRDWDPSLDAITSRRLHGFKAAHLRELIDLYGTLPFILVGDTSQQDPEIYASAVRDHPGRVLAVYIRDVTRTPARTAAVTRLAEELRAAQVPLVLSEHTLDAARHAASQGWIDADALAEVSDDKAKDEGTKPGKAPV